MDTRAGETGSVSHAQPAGSSGAAQWQTARERANQSEFSVRVRSSTAGPSDPFVEVIRSSTTLAWRATFEPFRQELPQDANWVRFVVIDHSMPEVQQLAARLSSVDERNPALRALLPESFERGTVVNGANADFAAATHAGVAVSMDALHSRVVSARLEAGQASNDARVAALPIMFPEASSLSWTEIANIRKLRGFEDWRRMMREITAEAIADEQHSWATAVASAHARQLRIANEQLASLHLPVEVVGAFMGLVTDVACLAFGVLPVGPSTVVGIGASKAAQQFRPRRVRRWLAVDGRIARGRSI